jgi:hypothetical protein
MQRPESTVRSRVRAFAAALTPVLLLALAGCSNAEARYVDAAAASTRITKSVLPRPPQVIPKTGTWISGASSELAANGSFGRWRKAPVQIGGTWDNGNQQQVKLESICAGGAWATWRRPLDIAVGAIDRRLGETWAAAAKGAYDERWNRSLARMKACWGSRNPANLYIRFAHEINLPDMPWHVKGGEEADFAAALTRFSYLRYAHLPTAHLVLCLNDGTNGELGIDIAKVWPGADAKGRRVVDVYSVDTYNSYLVVDTEAEFQRKLTATQANMPYGLELHRQIAEARGVPFAISEWSNNGDPKDLGKGGEAPEYMKQMNAWFREHAGDPKHPAAGMLLYEVQFNQLDMFSLLPTRHQPKTAAAYRSLTWGH